MNEYTTDDKPLSQSLDISASRLFQSGQEIFNKLIVVFPIKQQVEVCQSCGCIIALMVWEGFNSTAGHRTFLFPAIKRWLGPKSGGISGLEIQASGENIGLLGSDPC